MASVACSLVFWTLLTQPSTVSCEMATTAWSLPLSVSQESSAGTPLKMLDNARTCDNVSADASVPNSKSSSIMTLSFVPSVPDGVEVLGFRVRIWAQAYVPKGPNASPKFNFGMAVSVAGVKTNQRVIEMPIAGEFSVVAVNWTNDNASVDLPLAQWGLNSSAVFNTGVTLTLVGNNWSGSTARTLRLDCADLSVVYEGVLNTTNTTASVEPTAATAAAIGGGIGGVALGGTILVICVLFVQYRRRSRNDTDKHRNTPTKEPQAPQTSTDYANVAPIHRHNGVPTYGELNAGEVAPTASH